MLGAARSLTNEVPRKFLPEPFWLTVPHGAARSVPWPSTSRRATSEPSTAMPHQVPLLMPSCDARHRRQEEHGSRGHLDVLPMQARRLQGLGADGEIGLENVVPIA